MKSLTIYDAWNEYVVPYKIIFLVYNLESLHQIYASYSIYKYILKIYE